MNASDFQKIADVAEFASVEVALSPYGWRVSGKRLVAGRRYEAQRTVPFQLVDQARVNVLVAEIEFVARQLAEVEA